MMARSLSKFCGELLRPLVPLSYGKVGYALRQAGFDEGALDVDMSGKLCLVTGANSGIGYATSEALALRGATVWMLCRSRARGEEACARLRRETGNPNVELKLVDMSERSAIEAFVAEQMPSVVDRLIHSAAILPETYGENSEGVELTLATNLLGPQLLTTRLLPALEASKEGRVVHISSGGMFTQKLELEKLWSPPQGSDEFQGAVQYAQTKRALTILNEMWAERAKVPTLTFHCMHPGWADTPAVQSSLPTFHKITRSLLRSPDEGADTVIWLAIAHEPARHTGAFWFDRRRRGTHAFPWTQEANAQRAELWQRCDGWLNAPDSPTPTSA